MALTVKDILTLPALKSFHLTAGEGGLNRDIVTACIADYEFARGINYDLTGAFEKDSLVISSLLFAKDDPSIILPAIQFLHKSGVSAFAYKQVIFEELPPEVLIFAEKENFPIFAYKTGTWFENIIFDVLDAVERDDARYLSKKLISQMIHGTVSQSEIDCACRGISLFLNKTVSAAYIKTPDLDPTRIFRAYYMSKNLRDKVLVSKYEEGIFVLITTSTCTEESHRLILDEACQILSIPFSSADIMLSRIHPAKKLNKAYQEAYYGWAANLLSIRKTTSYESLGVYTAIMPLADSSELISFAKNYMQKLKGFEDTITAYINNGGDIVAASVDLCCHANTVRYRLGKMKELVGAKDETDHELFRDLSIAYVVNSISHY